MLNDPITYWYTYTVIIFFVINVFAILSTRGGGDVAYTLSLTIVILISIFIALRGERTGLDTYSYIMMTHGVEHITATEFIFANMAKITGYITGSHELFFLLSNIAIGWLFFRAAYIFDNKRYHLILAALLSTFFYAIINLSAMRQGVSLAVCALALAYLYRDKSSYFLILAVIAFLIHYSSIVLFLFYMVYLYKDNKKTPYILLALIAFSFSLSLADMLLPFITIHPAINKAWWYMSWTNGDEWRIKHFYYLSAALAVFVFTIKSKLNDKERLLSQWFFLGFIMIGLTHAGEMLADRLFYYSIFPGIVLLVSLSRFFKARVLFYLSAALILNLWFFGTAIVQFPNWFVPPYKSALGF